MQKRIVISLGLLISIFVIIILLIGCDKEALELKANCIGVIETADNYKFSGISWYDNDLKYKGSKKVNIPNMTNTANRTIKKDNRVYLISNDVNKTSTKSKIAIVDLKSGGRYRIYNSTRYINDMAVDKNLYTISCEYLGINMSFIDKIGDKNKKIATLKIDNVVLSKIYAYKSKLYVTGFGYDDKDRVFSKLFIIDSDNMKILKSIDISESVVDVTDMYNYDGWLYIGGRTKSNSKGKEVENNSLVKIRMDSYKCEKIYIGDIVGQFVETVKIKNDKYIIFSNYDAVFDVGNKIYSLNLESNKINQQQVEDKVRDVIIDKGYMYIMGEKYICKYAYKNNDILFENNKLRDSGKQSIDKERIKGYSREKNTNLIKKAKLKKIFVNKYSVFTCFFRN